MADIVCSDYFFSWSVERQLKVLSIEEIGNFLPSNFLIIPRKCVSENIFIIHCISGCSFNPLEGQKIIEIMVTSWIWEWSLIQVQIACPFHIFLVFFNQHFLGAFIGNILDNLFGCEIIVGLIFLLCRRSVLNFSFLLGRECKFFASIFPIWKSSSLAHCIPYKLL